MCTKYYKCTNCKIDKEINNKNFVLDQNKMVLITYCNDCSDSVLVENKECVCSVCKRKLPATYFTYYRTRFKKNGYRLRVNTNCKDCSNKESKIRTNLKKQHKQPNYLEKCPQCDKICYEKSEDIPEGVDGTNGPWQLDHDHSTKEFRGYLCKKCNTGTGLVGDNEDYWKRAKERKK